MWRHKAFNRGGLNGSTLTGKNLEVLYLRFFCFSTSLPPPWSPPEERTRRLPPLLTADIPSSYRKAFMGNIVKYRWTSKEKCTFYTIGLPKNVFFCYNQTGKIAWGGAAIERCRPPDTAKAGSPRRPAEGRRRGGEKNAAERERLSEMV